MRYRENEPKDPRSMDVWNARVYFDDLSGAKNRPVIILEKRGSDYTVLMSTTHGRHPNTDIRLYDPYEVGLDGSSCIRTDRLFKLPRDEVNYYMGHMCDEDIEMVSAIFEELKQTRAYRRNIY